MTEEIAEVLISEITGIGDEPNPTTIDPIFVEKVSKKWGFKNQSH